MSETNKKGFRLFRGNKSKQSNEGGGGVGGGPPVTQAPPRKGKLRRIRGLLNGRRSRKTSSEGNNNTNNNNTADAANNNAVEDDSVYRVDVDDRSTNTGTTSINSQRRAGAADGTAAAGGAGQVKKTYMLKVVLLLMDPESRRFELLQLEFDSLKALVSDVLAQIPISVTEQALRNQTYTGICGNDGKEMPPPKLLASFCKGNEVLVAIPNNVPAKECARLARPILNDEKVVSMLAASGIDTLAWKDGRKRKTPKPEDSNNSNNNSTTARDVQQQQGRKTKDGNKAKVSTTSKILAAILLCSLAVLLQYFHVKTSSALLPGGRIVAPGSWRSKCGLFAFLPSCENAYMSIGTTTTTTAEDKSGESVVVVSIYDASQQLAAQIKGNSCANKNSSNQENKNSVPCVNGLEFRTDGTIAIGGETIVEYSAYKTDVKLTPWPFAQPPSVTMVVAPAEKK